MCQICPAFRIAATIICILLSGTPTDAFPHTVRIINGGIAKPGQFPYQISLLKHGKPMCGGTIVAPQRVVTAAHCVTLGTVRQKAQHFRVLAGTNICDDTHNPLAVYTKVKRIRVDVGWRPVRLVNDYAVIITVDVLYTSTWSAPIGPLPLQLADDVPVGSNCVISGWGQMETKQFPRLLRFATVQVIAEEECAREYHRTEMPESTICALGSRHEDAGIGDSGGPMVCDGRLVGIVSYGAAEPKLGLPGVYARVSDNWRFLICRADGIAGGWSVDRLLAVVAVVAAKWVLSSGSEWGFL